MKKDTTKSLFLFWLCAVLLYFIANLQKVVMPGAIFNELQEHFSATAGSVTGIGAIFMYTYAISQLVVGLLVDRFSGARVMAYCVAAVSCLLSRHLFGYFMSPASWWGSVLQISI